ncbi:MAG TPA: hypothetical protein PLG90_12050, partial [Ignavibacteria bacterium]|nr:hypothetical protein [Ignavibacteria bacterium]
MEYLIESDYEKWNDFVLNNEFGNIFSTTLWYKSWNLKFKILAKLNENRDIEYGLIFQPLKKYLWNSITRPPFTLYNFPLIKNYIEFKTEYDKNNFFKKIYLDILENLNGFEMSDLNFRSEGSESMPFTWYAYDFYPS